MPRSGRQADDAADERVTFLMSSEQRRQLDALARRSGLRTRAAALRHAIYRWYKQEFDNAAIRDPNQRP